MWIRFAHRFGIQMKRIMFILLSFATNARMIRFAHPFGTRIIRFAQSWNADDADETGCRGFILIASNAFCH